MLGLSSPSNSIAPSAPEATLGTPSSKTQRQRRQSLKACGLLLAGVGLAIGSGAPEARADSYVALDTGERPAASGTSILPSQFLRGFDPITVYFDSNVGPGRGPADDGDKRLRVTPAWPGAYQWLDSKTLQFRPAEPWPALSRFQVSAKGKNHVLTTMMSAPAQMEPSVGASELRPFRRFVLNFPQALPLDALKRMLHVEVRQLPGLADSPRQVIDDIEIAILPRRNSRDPVLYSFTMREPVPEGHQLVVTLSLALGDEDKVLWTGRASTRPPFHLIEVRCAGTQANVAGGGGAPEERALDCGHAGQAPQLVFSAGVKNLTLSQLKKLVKLSPSVADLKFNSYGKRVQLGGHFLPDVLYRMRLENAPINDDSGRTLTSLQSGAPPEVYFFLGSKRPFVRWGQGRGVLEANGPRMMPVVGYGEPLADMRIHRIDPLATKIWPYPESPVIINEERAPPFPGEEPGVSSLMSRPGVGLISQHIRLLGSPLVSKVTELPLLNKSGATRFGLDLGAAIDDVVGKNRPGHYLVGLRRLKGAPQRAWVRVQITNLSLTSVEERDQAVFFVRRIDNAKPVAGARVTIEGRRRNPKGRDTLQTVRGTSDSAGRVVIPPPSNWSEVLRIVVERGEDTLVIDPREPPPQFANHHWSMYGSWLSWLTQKVPASPNESRLGFVVTDRPIYRPGDKVEIKAWVRDKRNGELVGTQDGAFRLRVEGPGGKRWDVATTKSALGGLSAHFQDAKAPTGRYQAAVYQVKPENVLARRQFRIEAYRVPRFEVQLTGPTRTRLDGPFSVKAFARYYAGGNVAGAPIGWRVTQRPYFHVPAGREGYLFASSTQFARGESGRHTGVSQHNGTLNDDGSASFEMNPALDMDGSARVYKFEATVTGADNQVVAATHEVRALPPFTLGMKLARFLPKAQDLSPEIIATGVDDKLLAGQVITVKLYKRSWHSHLRETHFATGEASYVTEQEDTLLIEKKVTTKKKALRVSLPVKTAGVYVVELVGRDKLGRVQTLNADLYVGGKERVAWRKSQHGVFELSSDKRNYAPGDTAQVLIKSPFEKASALVVIEAPSGNEYRWVDVRGSKAVVPVSISGRNVPNLPIHVVLMRGRLGMGKGKSRYDDSRYRPQTVASSLELKVKPTANQLKVVVQHAKTVRPGSKADFTIRLSDPAGRPKSGEVTLWLVDEAVLSLAPEGPLNPLSSFVVRNQRRSSIRDTRNTVVGRLAEEEETPGGDGDDASESMARKRSMSAPGAKRERRVRKNFATVPYYAATLTVGPSGVLKVPVTMSDDLTNFNVRAIAVSGAARFGHVTQRIRVRLPVIVQPQLPRFARQGDRFAIGGVARVVDGTGGRGSVDIKVTGPVDGNIRPKAVTLDPKKALSVTWPITVRSTAAEPSLTVKMGVTRKKDGIGDAFEVSIPIFPDRAFEETRDRLTLTGPSTPLPPFSETPRAGTTTQTAVVTTVPGLLAAVMGVDALVSYPHGCLEQKLSQLAPQVQMQALLNRLGAKSARADIDVAVTRLISDMALHQDERGLFGYWPGSTGNVAVTAQALEFMEIAKGLGIDVPVAMKKKAVGALRRVLRSDYDFLSSYRFNQQTSALAALTRSGEVDEHYLIDLFHDRKKMDASSTADLLSTIAAAPARVKRSLEKNMATLVEDVWERVVFERVRGKTVFKSLSDSRRSWRYGYLGSSTSALAAVFESLILMDPTNPKLPLLRDALLRRAGPTGFGSTHDNRRAVRALALYLDHAREGGGISNVSFGRQKVTLDSKNKVATLTLGDAAPKTATKTGTTDAYALLRRRFLPAKPGDRVGALANGFVVTRTFEVFAKAGGKKRFEDKRGQERELAIGDVVELSTTVVSDQDRHHVALVVPFAAGLEPLNPALKTAGAEAVPSHSDSRTPTYVQRLDQEVRYYFDFLPKGTHSFHFRTKATVTGSFTHPPPIAEGMYTPEVRGRGVGQRVIVNPAK